MKRALITLAFGTLSVFGEGDNLWVDSVSDRIDPQAGEWAEQMMSDAALTREDFSWLLKERGGKSCGLSLSEGAGQGREPSIMACISFSVPESIWLTLSEQLEQVGGVFVIRGLPDNSFSGLAKRLRHLIELGMRTPVVLDPNLFTEHAIDRVPTFLVTGKKESDKVVGNVSLPWVLECIEREGESGYRRQGGEDA